MMRRPLLPVAFAVAGALSLGFFAAAPASAATVTVTTWAELKAAFLVNGDTVVLGQNITATGVEFLTVEAGESVTLDLAGFDLAINTYDGGNDPAIHVSSTSTLTIAGTGGGTLTATGNNTSPGIGGSGSNAAGGTVVINGGTVTATGGRFGAGIGAGRFGTGGTTTINGGTVTAIGGGSRAAGIGGGGNSGAGGVTTITGGTVTATGGPYAAGIGGASNSVAGGTLAIHGTPDSGSTTNGGNGDSASNASTPITNPVTPVGVGYAATASLDGTSGRFVSVFHYLIGFDSAGGSSVGDQTINAGETITQPADPTRAGYEFAGWERAGSVYDFDTAVTSPIALVATWTDAPTAALAATGTNELPLIGFAGTLLLLGAFAIARTRRQTR